MTDDERKALLSLASSAQLEASAADRLLDVAKTVRGVCPVLLVRLAMVRGEYHAIQRLANEALTMTEGEKG